jgi:hypothetical protein
MIVLEEKYISEENYQKGRMLIDDAIQLLNGFINYLNSK